MTNKLENVKAARDNLASIKPLSPETLDTITEALTIYQAILEKRVLLVPVEPAIELCRIGANEWNLIAVQGRYLKLSQCHDVYKIMTQAVDQDELLKEILND